MMGKVPCDHQDIIKGTKLDTLSFLPLRTFQSRKDVNIWSIDY